MTETVGEAAFEGRRLRRPGVVVVAFLADWCPFCRQFLPEVERLAASGVTVLCADLSDEGNPMWETFEVAIVPTLILFREGHEVFRANGVAGVGLGEGAVNAVRDIALRLSARA